MAGARGAGKQSSRRSTFSVTPAAPGGAPALGALTGHAAFSRPSQRPPARQQPCSHESSEQGRDVADSSTRPERSSVLHLVAGR